MKAIVVKGAGGPEQLVYCDWPDPVLDSGEVLVKVEAAAANHADIWLRMGLLGPLPTVPGLDGAGTVADVAPDVKGIAIGTRVLVNPAVTCDACEYCYSGEHGLCRQRKAIGQYHLDGSFAEYVKIPWRNVHPIRDDLSFEEAAAMPTAFFTSWMLLTLRGGLAAGQTVLVMAAASGTGSAAVQIAKLFGARVIATAGSERKLDRARQWGADETINYSQENWAQRVLDVTDGEGAHLILDTLGTSCWDNYMKCIRVGGRIVTLSIAGGQPGKVDVSTLIRRQVSIIGSGPQGSKRVAHEVMRMINGGKLHGVVDRVFPLKDAAETQRAMEDRNVIGKLIVKP